MSQREEIYEKLVERAAPLFGKTKEEMNEPTQVKEEPFSWEEKLAEAREKELEKKPKGNRFI